MTETVESNPTAKEVVIAPMPNSVLVRFGAVTGVMLLCLLAFLANEWVHASAVLRAVSVVLIAVVGVVVGYLGWLFRPREITAWRDGGTVYLRTEGPPAQRQQINVADVRLVQVEWSGEIPGLPDVWRAVAVYRSGERVVLARHVDADSLERLKGLFVA